MNQEGKSPVVATDRRPTTIRRPGNEKESTQKRQDVFRSGPTARKGRGGFPGWQTQMIRKENGREIAGNLWPRADLVLRISG